MKWTIDEVCLLKSGIPTKELAYTLGRSEDSIYKKRYRLKHSTYEGIFAPEPLSKAEKEGRIYKMAMQMRVKIQ